MDKPKNTELNFLYLDEEDTKNKKVKHKTKIHPKNQKSQKVSRRAGAESAPEKEETFNFDNEIVIGVTKIQKENDKYNNKKQTNKKKKQNQSKNIATKENKQNQSKNKRKQKEIMKQETNRTKKKVKKEKIENKKSRFIKAIVKWTILLSMLIISFIFFMMSPLFNVLEIEVTGNEKINSDTVISLSKIEVGENIYKTSKKKIVRNIKENAYIQDVSIKRNLPNKIVINIKERKTTYMLEYANSYAYINNQGYILEITQEKIDVPIIMGYATKEEDIKAGNRLCDEDLEKLETVLKIVEAANGNEIGKFITKINIQNKQNYIIIMEEKKKTVYLGDASNLSNRIPLLKKILIDEEGVEGEIFINKDLNKQKAFFRKKE